MSRPPLRPPLLGRLLLWLRPLGEHRCEVEDDLRELFERRSRDRGHRYASWRYCVDAISLWRWAPSASRPHLEWPGVAGMRDDVTFAVRMFARQPVSVGITIAGLALAIGLGTAIFSLLNAMALRGPGVADPGSLYSITVHNLAMPRLTGGTSATSGNWASQDYEVLGRAVTSIPLAAAVSVPERVSFRRADAGQRDEFITAMPVSGSFFRVLGARTSLGRTLTPQDDQPGATAVVCLSHSFWTTRLAQDPEVVGSTIWLDDHPYTVVGVLDRGFRGLDPSPPALWVPFGIQAELWKARQVARAAAAGAEIAALRQQPALTPIQRARLDALQSELTSPPPRWGQPVTVVGRIEDGVSPQQVQAEVSSIAQTLASERGQPGDRPPTVLMTPIASAGFSPELRVATAITVAVIALLVFLACSNVANLLLANAAGRRREIGTRLALGASHGRIVRQLLTESLLLGSAAGAAGFVLATWLTPALARLLHLPPLIDFAPDLRVYVFAVGVTLLAGTFAGLAPARYGRRGDLLGALQAGRMGAPGALAPMRLRTVLLGAQAAGSILLLVLAALFTRSVVQATSFELGFDPDRLLTVSVPFSRGYDASRMLTYWEVALDRVRDVPGVSGAALVALPPFGGAHARQALATSEGAARQYVLRNEVTAEYFQAIGIPVLRGRTFTAEEVRVDAPVAVISAGLARRFWPNEEPIGSSLERVWGAPDAPDARPAGLLRRPPGTQIIGVVADTIARFGSYDSPTIYLPLGTSTLPAAHMVVSTDRQAELLTRRIQDAMLSVDPNLSPTPRIVRDGVRQELEMPSAIAAAAGLLAVTGVVLAAVGLFGVTVFVVTQRRHEVSVRLALGATGAAVARMLLRDSLRPVAIGMACGLALAILAGQAVARMLYGISGHDPIAVCAAVLVLLAAAVAAVLFPAVQAARVSPAEMLKQS